MVARSGQLETSADELGEIRDFVNTLDLERGDDGLAAWLAARDVEPTAGALRRAAALREALRALLLANNGIGLAAAAAAAGPVLEEAAGRARLSVAVAPGGPRLVAAAPGLDGALGRLLALAARAGADGSWSRLKACRADDCHWAFVDGARNRSRAWCSMRVCGNRAKARAFRARRG